MKRMFATALSVVIITGITSVSWANAEESSLTFSTKAWTQYLRSNGAIFHDGPVLQSDLLFSLPKGFYYDIWHSVGLDGTGFSSDFGDEIDHIFGWSGEIGNLGLDVGMTYIDFVDLLDTPRGDVVQPYIEANKVFGVSKANTLVPYLRIEALFPMQGAKPEKGVYIYGGVKHTWQIFSILAVNQKFVLLYDSGALGFGSGVLWQYESSYSLNMSKLVTFDIASLKFAIPNTSVSDGRKPELVFGIGLSFHIQQIFSP